MAGFVRWEFTVIQGAWGVRKDVLCVVSFLEVIAKREQEEAAPEKGVFNDLLIIYSLGVCACPCPYSQQLQRELVSAPAGLGAWTCMWLLAVLVLIYPVLLCVCTHPHTQHTHPQTPLHQHQVPGGAFCVLFILSPAIYSICSIIMELSLHEVF